MVGWLAKSLAGHDKERLYIIIEETRDAVLLADGETRPLAKPKKKKKKHVQLWRCQTEEVTALRSRLLEKKPVRDEEIKRALKLAAKIEMED